MLILIQAKWNQYNDYKYQNQDLFMWYFFHLHLFTVTNNRSHLLSIVFALRYFLPVIF